MPVPPVRTLLMALDVLELVARAGSRGISLSSICRELSLSKSTGLRILGTLESRGYVRRDNEGARYRLGIRALEMWSAALEGLDLREVARPELQGLVAQTDEIAHLAILDHGEVVYVDKIEGSQPIRIYSRIGRRAPAYCTGVGKALLSGLSDAELAAYLDEHPLKAFTSTTIVDRSRLLEELQLVRTRGYAFDMEEHEEGVRCVAAPLRDHTGRVVAAISLTAPAMRMSADRMQALAPLVVEAANRISQALGCSRLPSSAGPRRS